MSNVVPSSELRINRERLLERIAALAETEPSTAAVCAGWPSPPTIGKGAIGS